jgi:thiosulfate/3-mercaptopyruvate sulfurtransferase
MTAADFPNPAPLIDVVELYQRLDEPGLRIFDTTVQMAAKPGGGYVVESGRAAWDRGHIRGAGFLDLLEEFADRSHRLRFMMPPETQLVERLGARGIAADNDVVLYNAGPTWWATRFWFMLREVGFDRARVLDGGLDAWVAAGRPLSQEPCGYAPTTFSPGVRRRVFVGRDRVLQAVQRRDEHLVNALSPEVFRGEVVNYGRPGRIASSVNVVARDLLDPVTQRFLPAADLRRQLSAAGVLDGRPVIHYCGGGISASTDAFAMILLGYPGVTIYDASMTEWGPDASLPMESG